LTCVAALLFSYISAVPRASLDVRNDFNRYGVVSALALLKCTNAQKRLAGLD
jgi:hypothetical protein